MCLAVPARIVSIGGDDTSGPIATIDLDGVRRDVSTMLLDPPPKVAEWVIVHVGFAIERLDEAAAHETLELLGREVPL